MLILEVEAYPSAPLTPRRLEQATTLHEGAWNNVVNKAATNNSYKYALYAARILAVKHPEVYLQGDSLFVEHITSQGGFAAAYEELDPHAQSYYDGFAGRPFGFEQVDFLALKTVPARDLYPSSAPFYPFLDCRVLPVAACLKTASRTLTELEKAFLLYFDRKEELASLPFLIYCDNERAYLATMHELFSIRDWKEVSSVDGNPILIFNERWVWYPLMNRDDTHSNPTLNSIVEKHRTSTTHPEMLVFERRLVDDLQFVTKLEAASAVELAALAAVGGLPDHSDSFSSICRKSLPNHPLDLWKYIGADRIRHANYLSPLAAYLAADINELDVSQAVERMTSSWHVLHGTDHGHIWQCTLVQYTIDSIMRIRYVHCVLHATSMSAVLDLAGVANYHIDMRIDGFSGGHSFVSIPEIGYVISNGELEDRGTVLNGRYNTLRFVSSADRWAVPHVGFYCGNWSPADLAGTLEHLESLYGDEIHGFTVDRDLSMDKYFKRTFLHSDEFIPALKAEQQRWEPLEHP